MYNIYKYPYKIYKYIKYIYINIYNHRILELPGLEGTLKVIQF